MCPKSQCPKSQFLYPKLTFVKVIEWGKRVKVPLGCLLVHWNPPRPAKCTKNKVIFSNRYIHIPTTSKYPEKMLKLWKLCGELLFLWWLGGSRIYMRFCLEKICPWRHSNCWLPNSFILGGEGGIQSSEMLVKCNFPVLPFKKKHINIFSNQWQLQAFQLAAHLGDKTKVFINDGDPLLKPHSVCSTPLAAGCVLFSQKPIYLRYVSKIAIFVRETHFCQGYRMGKASKSAFGLPVGSLKLFMESLPRPEKCTKNNVIFSNRYIHIPRASKYPEKIAKTMKIMW